MSGIKAVVKKTTVKKTTVSKVPKSQVKEQSTATTHTTCPKCGSSINIKKK